MITNLLETVIVKTNNSELKVFSELKEKNGIFNTDDTFFAWAEELENTEYTQSTLDFINELLDNNPSAKLFYFE